MTPEHLVKELKEASIDFTLEEIIEDFVEESESNPDVLALKQLVTEKMSGEGEDSYAREVPGFLKELSNEQQRALLLIVKQSLIDSLATVFAAVDGVSRLEGQQEDFLLTNLADPELKLNEGLTDLFLQEVYEWKR